LTGFYPVKKLILAVAIVFGWASAAWAVPPAKLTTLRQITGLSNAQAANELPVAFEATVTYKGGLSLFVQDEGSGVYVFPKTNAVLLPGDRILIQGKTAGSFHPTVVSESISVLHHGDLPKPVPATYNELIRTQHDCVLVRTRGVIRTADKSDPFEGSQFAKLQVLTEGGYIIVVVAGGYPGDASSSIAMCRKVARNGNDCGRCMTMRRAEATTLAPSFRKRSRSVQTCALAQLVPAALRRSSCIST
jgi:hypothetical protein